MTRVTTVTMVLHPFWRAVSTLRRLQAASPSCLAGVSVAGQDHRTSNLMAVAHAYRAADPNLCIVITSEEITSESARMKPNDKPRHNVGRLKTEAAVEAIGGALLIPPFEPQHQGSDWTDLCGDCEKRIHANAPRRPRRQEPSACGVGPALHIDMPSAIMLVPVAFIRLSSSHISRNYLDADSGQIRSTQRLCATLAAVLLPIISGNLFQFALAWIATSIGAQQVAAVLSSGARDT
jgi:hypothetical protein